MVNSIELMKARLAELRAEKEALKEKTEELRAEREKAAAIASDANARAEKLTAQINAIERPRMIEIGEEMSRLAMALGGKRMGG